MSSFEVLKGDIVFETTGIEGARLGAEELQRSWSAASKGISSDILAIAAAQERLTIALARSGGRVTGSVAKAEIALRSLQEGQVSAAASADVAGSAFAREGRDIERLGRGALVGSGLVRGLGRAAAFSSTAFLGGAGLVFAVRSFVNVAQEHIVLEGQLRTAVTASGNSYQGYKSEIDGAIAAAEKLGFTEADSVTAFTKLVVATGSVTRAQHLMGLSADIARKYNKSLADSAGAVAKAAGASGATGVLKRLVPAIEKGATASKALEQAQDAVAGSAQNYAHDVAGAHDRASVAIKLEEERIGTGLLPMRRRLDDEISTYLGKASNQRHIQDEVNRAIKDGTEIVHGLVKAERLVAPPIHAIVGALGGLENAVEAAFIVGLAVKAQRAAAAIGSIGTVSRRVRDWIVADSAVEQKALAATGAVAVTTAGEEALTAAGGAAAGGKATTAAEAAAGGVGAGALLRGALGKGARILTKGGELYLVYKGVTFALNPQPGSDGGANRYGGSLSHGWGNLFSDVVHGHLGRVATDTYKGIANEAFGAHYGSSNTIKNPLTFLDVLPAIQGGYLSIAALKGLRPRFTSQADYNGALALLEQALPPKPASTKTLYSGTFPLPGYLSPAQTQARNLALHPNDLGALGAQVAYDNKALAFLETQRSVISGKDYLTKLQAITANRDSYQGQIDQINQAARSKADAARLKAAQKEKAAEAKAAREYASGISIGVTSLRDRAGQELRAQVGHIGTRVIGGKVSATDATFVEPTAEKKLTALLKKEADDQKLSKTDRARYHHLYLVELASEQKDEAAFDTKVTAILKKAQQQEAAKLKTAQSLRDAILGNRVLAAQVAEAMAGTNAVKLKKAQKAELAADLAIFNADVAAEKGLTGLALRTAQTKTYQDQLTYLALKNQTKPADNRGANEAQFLASAQNIIRSYDPNFGQVPALLKQTNTHLFNVAHEARQQTHAVKTLTTKTRFPGSWQGLEWVDGAAG